MATETEPIPNLIMGNSEWVAGKSKKRDGFSKPKSELLPSRISESAIFGALLYLGCDVSGLALLRDRVKCDQKNRSRADNLENGAFITQNNN